MLRKLYFIRHIPTGQWYTSSRTYSEDFEVAAIFHQRANAEKQLRVEALIYKGKFAPQNWGINPHFQIDCEERDFGILQNDGTTYCYRDTRQQLPITENTFKELEVAEFALCECTEDGELL